MTSTWNKAKQFLAPSIKILVLIGCITLLYFQWQDKPVRMDSVLAYLKSIPYYSIVFMLILSLASWLVESKKWQLLVREVEEIRFRESVLQSLTAQAASFITPLRAGEFAFKALFYDKENRKTILSRVFLGNFCQMAVTVFLGIIGLSIMIKNNLDGIFFFGIIALLLACLIILIFMWLQNKFKIKEASKKLLWNTLGLSLLRYMLFASNWLILLQLLKTDVTVYSWLDKIAVNYLAVSVIPMFQIFDIPVKWKTAGYIFNGNLYDADYIIVITSIIWLTNTLFPTLLGCILLPFKKLKTV